MANGKWVSVEGIIGAGKSTLVNKYRDTCIVVDEPVKLWEESGILELMYKEPQIYNFPAQCHFFHSRIKAFRQAYQPGKTILSDRSVFTDLLFWNTQLQLGRVDPLLHSIYMDMWKEWQNLLPIKYPTSFIYLRPDIETCMNQVEQRNRSQESTITLDYQKELLRQHDALFLDPLGVLMLDGTTRVPVQVIRSNEENILL
jgi:deoxyadenosine/deoxycytidine kinase